MKLVVSPSPPHAQRHSIQGPSTETSWRATRASVTQQTIGCAACGRFLHVHCATRIAWHHLWFSNLRMRAFIERHGLVGVEIALCSACGWASR